MRQKTETFSEWVAMRIRQHTTENKMKVGDRLPNELQMTEYCKVGRGAIRDTIELPWFEGLAEVVQGSDTYLLRQKRKPIELSEGETSNFLGAFLPEELPAKVLEFSGVRLILKPDIAALAVTNTIHEDCRKLMELEAEVRWQIQMQESHYERDIVFHLQITRCSKNETACRLMEIMARGISLFCKVTNDKLINQAVKLHYMISESIKRGDASGARYSMVDHLNNIRRKITEEVEQQKTRKVIE